MRQIWIPKIGGPEVLEVREVDDPAPAAGEVRIRVEASGVNFADILARMGLYPDAPPLPLVVGYEVAGTVDAVGSGVETAAVGDRVLALTRFGGYSDVVTVASEQAAPLGPELGFEAAAAIPVNYLTAWLMLVELGNVRPEHTVLVHAAAGGVGQAALQICRHHGAKVIGTASAGKHERLLELGAQACIDYRNQDFEQEVARITDGAGVDLCLDAVGGASFGKSYRSLAPMGRLFMFGISSFAPGRSRSILSALGGLLRNPSFKPVALMNENKGVFGVNIGRLWQQAERLRSMLAKIMALVDEGAFTPVVDKAFAFDDASSAHAYIQDRKNFGKIVLRPEL